MQGLIAKWTAEDSRSVRLEVFPVNQIPADH